MSRKRIDSYYTVEERREIRQVAKHYNVNESEMVRGATLSILRALRQEVIQGVGHAQQEANTDSGEIPTGSSEGQTEPSAGGDK